MVIADGKRGDISISALAYAQALIGATPSPFGSIVGLGADAATVNPLMGTDAIVPFVDTAREHGRGLFVLVRTSNPGAADIQELEVSTGGQVWERLAELVGRLGADDVASCGLSSVGAVVAATAPGHLERLRELLPRAVFLMPGVGAQGGVLDGLGPAFASGPASALVAVSRGIAEAHAGRGGEPAEAARIEAERLRALAWDLAGRHRG
jgi:orotidine-5'-phosphate decarboxylase